jgi:hypothetical protein
MPQWHVVKLRRLERYHENRITGRRAGAHELPGQLQSNETAAVPHGCCTARVAVPLRALETYVANVCDVVGLMSRCVCVAHAAGAQRDSQRVQCVMQLGGDAARVPVDDLSGSAASKLLRGG